jgi:hypothetical protein
VSAPIQRPHGDAAVLVALFQPGDQNRVAHRHALVLEDGLRVGHQVVELDAIPDPRLRHPDARRDRGGAVLLGVRGYQRAVAGGLLERRQVLAVDVFDELHLERFLVGVIAAQDGHGAQAGDGRGAIAAFAGHDLDAGFEARAAVLQRSHDERLEHAFFRDAHRQLLDVGFGKVLPGIRRRRHQEVDRHVLDERGLPIGGADRWRRRHGLAGASSVSIGVTFRVVSSGRIAAPAHPDATWSAAALRFPDTPWARRSPWRPALVSRAGTAFGFVGASIRARRGSRRETPRSVSAPPRAVAPRCASWPPGRRRVAWRGRHSDASSSQADPGRAGSTSCAARCSPGRLQFGNRLDVTRGSVAMRVTPRCRAAPSR